MSTLAKLVRLQPRTLRTLSLATPKLYRSSLTRAVYFSWSPISMRYPIGGRLKPRPRNKLLYKSEGYQQWQEEEAQPSRSLFVSNIHYRANHEHLREIFSPLGPIDHVYLFPEPEQGHRGCARVDFVKSEDAIAVYESSQAEPFFLMKRALTIEYARKPIAKNHVLFFRHFKGNEEDLRVILEDYKDHIIQIIFTPPFNDGQAWDRGHIVFANDDSDTAEEVLNKFNGKMTAAGCRLHLEYSIKTDTGPEFVQNYHLS